MTTGPGIWAAGDRPVLGGGARSRVRLEMLDRVLELQLQRTAVGEGSPLGAALQGGVAVRR